MRKIVKKTALWRCPVCKTDYRNRSDARACEGMSTEKPNFKVGDTVTNRESRICSHVHRNTSYRFQGKVVMIFGPEPPDEEYWNKWMGGDPHMHVFSYIVAYTCPRCGKKKRAAYFGPELDPVKK